MKRLKKLALVSASALMLMSASVSTIDAVNGTVLATKKSKKGLKATLVLNVPLKNRFLNIHKKKLFSTLNLLSILNGTQTRVMRLIRM